MSAKTDNPHPETPAAEMAQPVPSYAHIRLVPQAVWAAVRDAVVAEVPMPLIEARTGVREAWIQRKATDEDWLTPARRREIAASYGLENSETLSRVKADLSFAAAALTAERALEHRAFVVGLVTEKMQQADVAPPSTWRDMDVADRMARRSLGLDDGPSINALIQLGSLDADSVDIDASWQDPYGAVEEEQATK